MVREIVLVYENCLVIGYKNSDLCYYYNNFIYKKI